MIERVLQLILSFIFILMGFAPRGAFATPTSSYEKAYVDELTPTQKSVGMLEVARKAEKLKKMTKEERHEALQKPDNIVPVVLGPEGKKYAIDGHHLCRAVIDAGFKSVYIKVVLDLSHKSPDKFKTIMKQKGYFYLKDENGEAIKVKDLPKHFKDLVDDPFRSLAGAVRRAGGYIKSQVPFSEFVWADFFRSRISFDNTNQGLAKILDKALELAHSEGAKEEPGHISGAMTCEDLYNY